MIWRGHLNEATPTNLSLISVMLVASIVLNEAIPIPLILSLKRLRRTGCVIFRSLVPYVTASAWIHVY